LIKEIDNEKDRVDILEIAQKQNLMKQPDIRDIVLSINNKDLRKEPEKYIQ